jgi:threonylcarbamoyladenosine tRNA methylthiotransferase MtaB
MKKVAFYTLGCKLNFSETSTISRQFEDIGFQKVDFFEKPDVYIINTCSVTENADKKCRKIVKDALKHSPTAFIAIVGCYAQLKPKEISEIPGVDVVLGASEKFRLHELIPNFEKLPKAEIFNKSILEAKEYHASYSVDDRTRTFLKVQDGCNYTCSFCTIPLARGESRSDTIENIVKLATDIGAKGVKEIVLTGVNIGDFGIQGGQRQQNFLELIQALDEIPGVERFRISSIEPNLLSDDIISFVKNSNKFVPHFHIPLQSGSNKILKLMRRRYLRELYSDRITYIREIMPHACVGVDVIVGFPEETENDFLETNQFLNELDINYLHVFTYSERPNTHALTLKGSVPLKERQRRSEMLRILSEKKRRAFYESNLGKTANILLEHDPSTDTISGFTENYVRVSIPREGHSVNDLIKVQLENFKQEAVEIEGMVYAETGLISS